jgi:ribosomal RNA-processing protein 8
MSLFEVPGWSVPATPVQSSSSKKRKRSEPETDAKVQSATINVERLIAKLGQGDSGQTKKKANKGKGKATVYASPDRPQEKSPKPQKKAWTADEAQSHKDSSRLAAVAGASRKGKNKKSKGKEKPQQPAKPAEPLKKQGTLKEQASPAKGLTTLQANMKHSLDGARFR